MEITVKGVTFRNEDLPFDRQEIISSLSGKEKVYLKREPNNRFDKNAVAVMVKRKKKDQKIGYVRAELAAFLADLWPKYKFIARISEIRTGDLKKKIPYGISLDISKVNRSKLRKKKFNKGQNRERG